MMNLEQKCFAMEADPLFGRYHVVHTEIVGLVYKRGRPLYFARPLKEVYYLWRLTNTSLERHLQGVHASAEPSINRLPRFVFWIG